jgi:prolipoprotein diacylglyceryltransferase
MYPDLSYLFHALIGTEPDNWLSIFKTFGFFLSIAFLCSAVVFYYELKRKAKLGFFNPAEIKVTEGGPTSISEIITNAVIGLIIGGKGWYAYEHYESFRHDPASVILSQHFAWIPGIIGAVLFGGYSWWESVRRQKKGTITRLHTQYPHHRISEFTIWAAVGGILGAKIFDVFDNWDTFIDDPVGTLASGGGLAFFGGLVFGFIAVVTFMVRNKIPFLPTADAVAPALATGYGVGRIGCQFSGDGDWGIVNANPKPGWLQWMPDNWWATPTPTTS